MNYDEIMAAARETNQSRDGEDREFGFAPPRESGPALLLQTAMQAIECGIRTDDWGAVAEGQAMLEDLCEDIAAETRGQRT